MLRLLFAISDLASLSIFLAYLIIDFSNVLEEKEIDIKLRVAETSAFKVGNDSLDFGSIEVGETIVKEYLKKKYNNIKGVEEPTLRIFKKCEHYSDPFCPVTHLWNYSRDEDRPSKRSDEYKDWPDTLRYLLERYPRFWDTEKHKELPKKKTYFKR